MPDPSAPRTAADRLLPALVVLAAFLVASFPARNSDVWLRLALGRAVATGTGGVSSDPFTFAGVDQRWANPNWLWDLVAYWLFSSAGGAGLVMAKAIAVGLLAVVLIRLGRSSGPGWVAPGFALVSVVALSPRLVLQPAVVSYLLLAVTLLLLRTAGRAVFFLPLLVAVWANLDSWFVLAPPTVLLYQLGRRWNADDTPPVPIWMVPACLAACLLTPNHIHGLALPTELSPAVWGSAFRTDPRFAGFFADPWRTAAPSDWAFLALLSFSGLSFLLNSRAWGWRLAIWLPFAALACWQARLVPFFAVVGGPIAVLNFGERLSDAWDRRAGRNAVSGGAVAAMALAGFGWLTGFAGRDREIGWEVVADPGLREAAEAKIGAAYENTHPDLGPYIAWFDPESMYLYDFRLVRYTRDAADVTVLGRAVALLPDGSPDDDQRVSELGWGRGSGLPVYDPDLSRMATAIARLSASAKQWELSDVRGGVLFVRRTGSSTTPPPDANRLTFGLTVPVANDIPAVPPTPWWDLRLTRPRRPAAESNQALVLVQLAEATDKPGYRLLAVRAGRRATAEAPSDPIARLALARAYLLLGQAERAFPLAGFVRRIQATTAARQATLADPDSAHAHSLLADLLTASGVADAALPHRERVLRLARRSGDSQRIEKAAAALRDIEAAVFDAENRFLVQTDRLTGDPLGRARVAAAFGLGGRAIDVLLAASPDLYGPDGLRLLLELLFAAGRADEAAALLDRPELADRPDALGLTDVPGGRLPAAAWYHVLKDAVAGRPTGDRIVRVYGRLSGEANAARPQVAGGMAGAVAAEVGLATPLAPPTFRFYPGRDRDRWAARLEATTNLGRFAADLLVVAGLLELDAGRPAAALTLFDRALADGPAAGKAVAESSAAAIRAALPR